MTLAAARPTVPVRRVLMTTDAVGGVWTFAIELAAALARTGTATVLATMGPEPSAAQRTQAAQVPGLELRVGRFRLEWMDEPWDDVDDAGLWLLELEQETRPDVVHLNGYAHGALPFRAPVVVVGHSCVLSWWQAVHGRAAPARWRTYEQRVRAGLRGAALVAAPTAAMLLELARHYGPLGPALVVANGRDPALFPAAAKEPFMLAAGRLWDPAKNLEALERVAPALPWPVRVAGETRRPGGGIAATRAVEPLGALSAAEFAGWLGRASIYVHPARYEPFGLGPLEAALAGCALVARRPPEPARGLGRRRAAGAGRRRRGPGRCPALAHRRPARTPAPRRALARARPRVRTRPPRPVLDRNLPRPPRRHRHRHGRRRRATGGPRRAHRDLLPLALLRLEPRQRALPARRRQRAARARACASRSSSRATAGAATNLRARARRRRRSTPSAPPIPTLQPTRYDRETLDLDAALRRRRPRASCTSGTTRRWSRRIGAARARPADASRCSSTTPTTARSPTRRRWRPTTSPTTTACSPSARCSRELYLERGWCRARLDLARGRRHRASSGRCRRRPQRRRPGLDRQLGRRRARPASSHDSCSSRCARSA